MTKRKSITTKIRFEVFKRDSFTCQYCGKKAPDVVLEIDHIKPVVEGGNNDIMNLISSCFECNRGKGKNELSDNSIIEKQRKQIEELNLRRVQLEMLLEWKTGLANLNEHEAEKVSEYISKICGFYLSEVGIKNMQKLIKKFGISDVLEAVDISFNRYHKGDQETCEIAIKKIGGICALKYKPEHEQKMAYISGILKNRISYVNFRDLKRILINYHEDGNDLDELMDYAKNVRSWTQFRDYMVNFNF